MTVEERARQQFQEVGARLTETWTRREEIAGEVQALQEEYIALGNERAELTQRYAFLADLLNEQLVSANDAADEKEPEPAQ